MSSVRGFISISLILISALDFILGCDFDSCHRGCGHARCHHCAEQLFRLGPVCGGLPAEQQLADHRGGAHRLFRRHPVLHHVCGKKQVFECKGNGVVKVRICLLFAVKNDYVSSYFSSVEIAEYFI